MDEENVSLESNRQIDTLVTRNSVDWGGGGIGFLLFHKVSTSLNPAIKILYPRKRRGFGPFILFFERRTSGTQQTDTTKSRSWSDKQ